MDKRTKLQKDILDSVDMPHGILLLAPRVGKTKIGIDFIKRDRPKSILWVTPSEKLRDVDIPNEFRNWSAVDSLNKTSLVCWRSLDRVVGHYDLIILDEYQEITDNNSIGLFNGNISYDNILCLSGTHPSHEDKNEILKNLNLKILKEITIDEAVEAGLISDYEVIVVEVSLDDIRNDVDGGNDKKRFKTTERKNYLYLSKTLKKAKKNIDFLILKRMQSIYNSKSKEQVAKFLIDNLSGRKLIFAGSIEQAERLSPYTFHSKTNSEDLEKFVNQEVDILACVKSGGVGFTYKDLSHLIIVQADSDKKGETTQRMARSLLFQLNYKAKIWIICLTQTQDVDWIDLALQTFDKDKIKHVRYKTLEYGGIGNL